MQVSTMNKTALRAACKAAGITGYSKMNVAQMREALTPAKPAPVKTTVQRDAVKRPGGPKCAAVWSFCDSFLKKNSAPPTLADAREWAKRTGANENNAVIETSAWRKAYGYTRKEVKAA